MKIIYKKNSISSLNELIGETEIEIVKNKESLIKELKELIVQEKEIKNYN